MGGPRWCRSWPSTSIWCNRSSPGAINCTGWLYDYCGLRKGGIQADIYTASYLISMHFWNGATLQATLPNSVVVEKGTPFFQGALSGQLETLHLFQELVGLCLKWGQLIEANPPVLDQNFFMLLGGADHGRVVFTPQRDLVYLHYAHVGGGMVEEEYLAAVLGYVEGLPLLAYAHPSIPTTDHMRMALWTFKEFPLTRIHRPYTQQPEAMFKYEDYYKGFD